jgi:hypothetical protein
MQKRIFTVLFTFIFLSTTALAQTTPLQITNGKFSVFGDEASQIETSLFTATGSFSEHSESVWYHVCSGGSICRSGSTFRLPFSTRIGQNIGTFLPFSSGSFSINGVNYPTAYYYGGRLNFSDNPQSEELMITIPKNFNLRRKGMHRITRPFVLLPSNFRVCEVTTIDRGCPADKVLFDGQIQGHGTVTITLHFFNGNPQMPLLIRKSFEYQFEP